MKVVIGAAMAALLLTGAAFAQTETVQPPPLQVAANSQCGELDSEPTLPDGASADNRAFMAGDVAYQTWGNGARAVLECRRAEIAQVEARLRTMLAEHNAGAQRLNALTQTWLAHRTTYCAREGIECRPVAP